MRGHPHPPLDSWYLAALIALGGGVNEIGFHAAYLLFSLIALASMWWLAGRFARERRVEACLLFLAVPAFVINATSLEADLPVSGVSGSLVARSFSAPPSEVVQATMAAARVLPCVGVPHGLSGRGGDSDSGRLVVVAQPAVDSGWILALMPAIVIGAYQLFERLSSGDLPASRVRGVLQHYGLRHSGTSCAAPPR